MLVSCGGPGALATPLGRSGTRAPGLLCGKNCKSLLISDSSSSFRKREPIRSCAGRCGGGQPENPAGFWLTGYSGGEARTGTSVRAQLLLVVVSAQRAKADGGVEVPGRTGRSRYPAVTHCDLHS